MFNSNTNFQIGLASFKYFLYMVFQILLKAIKKYRNNLGRNDFFMSM